MDRAELERQMDEYMEADELAPVNIDSEPPVIGDLVAVDQVLRRIKRHSRDIEQVQSVTATEIERLERFRDDKVAGLMRAIEWDQRSVEAFMRGQASGPGGKRTITRVDGELKLRPQRASVEITDMPAFLAWTFGLPEQDPTDPDSLKLTIAGEEDGGELVTEQVQSYVLELLGSIAAHPGALRIKVEPDRTELAKGAPKDDKGKPVFTDGVAPVLYGAEGQQEMVPGVELRKDPTDKFTATPSKED